MAGDPEKRFERAMDRLFSTDRPSASCPATPATSSARVSSPVRGNNAVTSAVAFREQKKALTYIPSPNSRPLCRPWDRGDILRRLATFKSMTWFGKPQVAGPVACARRGWLNVDVDLLACEGCGAHLSFVLPPAPWSRTQVDSSAEIFAEQLDSGHKALCPWKGNACSEALTLFPPTPLAALVGGYHDRCEGLLQLSALPVISGSAIDTFKVLRGPQIESLLAQSPPFMGGGFQQAAGAESGDRSENGYSYDGFYQAQRLIALCGWEPRLLPYTVDCVEGPAPPSKISQSGEPCDVIVSRKSRDPGPSVLLFSKGDKGEENTEAGHNKEIKCDPASAVLDCSLCRASVGLWGFSTIPRPPALVGAATADVPKPPQNLDAQMYGASAASGVDGGSTQGRPAKDTVELCEAGGEEAPATPVRAVRSSAPGVLNLSLTIAGGPPPTLLSSPAMIPPTFGPIPGFLPRIGQPEGSEVGDFVTSYESRSSRDHDNGAQLGGSTVDTLNDRLLPADSTAEGTVVDLGVEDGDNGKVARSLKWRRSSENSAVDQLSEVAALTSGTANVITEVDAHRKRRKTTEATAQAAGVSAHFFRHGLRDILPCSSSVNAVDTHYLQKQENSVESVENQFQESDGHETAVSAENDIDDQVGGTETVGQAAQSGAREAGSGRSVQQEVEQALSKSDEVECADDGVETNVAVISSGTGVAGGASVGMGGGSFGTQASHEVEMQGEVNEADFSVHQQFVIPGDAEYAPEVIEYQGLMGEFLPERGLMGESIPEDEEKAGPSDVRGDSYEVMLARRPGKQQRSKDKGTVESESGKTRGKRVYDDYDDQTVDTTKAIILYGESGQEKEATDGHTAAAIGGEDEDHGCTTVNGPRRGLEEFRMWDTETGEFDPIRQHRHFCPWVNGHVAAAASSSSGQAGIGGWQLTVDALCVHQQEGNTHLAKSESTVSVYKANSLVSGHKLTGASTSYYLGRRTLF